MYEKLVSVLIPVYNVQDYVKDAIGSILSQSYKNLEIIVVDDCSTDSTYSILRSMEKMDPRLKVFRNSSNLGIAKTLNIALSKSNGDFIARMDGDDISDIDRIRRKVFFLENNPEFHLVGCSMVSIDVAGETIGRTTHSSDSRVNYKALGMITPVSHIWVAKREVYSKLNGYREVPYVEDYDFILRMDLLGFKYTNLSDYYGYFVRIGRDGNTVSRNALMQRRMFYYVYKMYVNQKFSKLGPKLLSENLSFSLSENLVFSYLHQRSCFFLQKAIVYKSRNSLFLFSFYLALSLVSPYQLRYLFERVMIRLYKKGLFL